VHTAPPVARELEHPRPERGQDAPVGGDGRLGGVELVEIRLHRCEWLVIAAGLLSIDELRVAHTEAEEEASGELRIEVGDAVRDVLRRVQPEVEDPRRHRDA
jgi:hypothetical protein